MNKTKKLTFFSNVPLNCPVCLSSFYKEELLSGSGRLIAGELTDELRRIYEPSKKFGELYPLIYNIIVCPSCYYAAYPMDFEISNDGILNVLKEESEKRKSAIHLILPDLNFSESRELKEGAASFYLSAMCYEHFTKEYSPTIKNGVSCLRAAWLFSDIHRKQSNENYDYISRLFYRKSRFYYLEAIEREQRGKETVNALPHLGPDLDKNYGYDGVLYISGLMEYKFGPRKDPEKRVKNLEKAKTIIARVHGMGRASKQRPSAILEKTKDLFGLINDEIRKIKGEDGNKT